MNEALDVLAFIAMGLGGMAGMFGLLGVVEDGWPPWRRKGVPDELNRVDTAFLVAAPALMVIGTVVLAARR